jgi:ABC-2 type transport system ATP-binding protein
MEEAERLCTQIGITDSGRIRVIDTPGNLINTLKGDVLTVICSKPQEFIDKINELKLAERVESVDGSIRLTIAEAEKIVPVVVELASSRNIEIKSISIHKPTLNDVFLYFTGREIREEEAENQLKTHMRTMSRLR